MNPKIIRALALLGSALAVAALIKATATLTMTDIECRTGLYCGADAVSEPVKISLTDKPPETAKITVPPEPEPETSVEVSESLDIPELPTYKKSLTDYRRYRKPGTLQLALQLASRTDERGFRRYGDDYEAAMGSYYSETIGDRFYIEFDSGDEITVILADGKGDDKTDERHLYQPWTDYDGTETANVLELIVDTDVLPKSVYKYGSAEKVEGLRGNIVKIKYLGRAEYNDAKGIFEPVQAA